MGLPERLWVIVRSTGEYSDRIETPIRYCLTQAEAEQAVRLTSIEAQRDAAMEPEWRSVPIRGWQMPDGSFCEAVGFRGPLGAKFRPYPDAEERTAQNALWEKEHDAACLALGHVDPAGSWTGDEYYFREVTLWQGATNPAPSPAPKR